MSKQLERALAIVGADWDRAYITQQITTCCECGDQIEPQIVPGDEGGEAVVVSPMCEGCTAKNHLWHETHCANCYRELPKIELEPLGLRLCGDECKDEYSGVTKEE